MLLFVPYEIETLVQVRPWANWLLIGVISAVSLFAFGGEISDETLESMVLYDWNPTGIFGHVLLHGGLMHLIGNMIFLWVFGNALCTNTNNFVYLAIFIFCTFVAASTHLLVDNEVEYGAIGASGAINGITGFILAMYPLNRVHCFYLFFIRGGLFEIPAWVIILLWLAFDIFGAFTGVGSVAYWAHIGGLGAGVIGGLICLQFNWIQVTEYDNRNLLEILTGRHPE
jgi:membrane associated rhomboid family serine protease